MTVEGGEHDVVIVGGGAAGLSAALVLGRARRRVAVIDAGEPRNAPAAHMHGFISRDGTPPAELLAAGRNEIAAYGVARVEDTAVAVEASFVVRTAGGLELAARRLVLATGLRDELPEIPGVRERWGRDLLHCPYCHGWEVRDLPLGVLGTNEAAVEHAHLVRQWSDDVVYFLHTQELDDEDAAGLEGRGIRVVAGEIQRLVVEDDRLVGVELASGEIVPRTAVFVRPRFVPRDGGLARALGCALDDGGFPVVDATWRTSRVGVWAVGNAADPKAQVVTAAGAGSAAAIALNADLVREDVRRAFAASSTRRRGRLPASARR